MNNQETKMDALKKLREPFDEKTTSQLPKPMVPADQYKALPKGNCNICGGYHATTKTMHFAYVGHAALTDRLLEVDPFWSWEPMSFAENGLPLFDESGGLWIKLTVCGMTRIGYGHAKENKWAEIGSRTKEIIGDGLRNAGMRFGMALDLWHKGELYKKDDTKEDDVDPVNDPTTAAYWENEADNNSKTLGRLKTWYGEHAEEISGLIESEKKFVNSYVSQLKDTFENESRPVNNGSKLNVNI